MKAGRGRFCSIRCAQNSRSKPVTIPAQDVIALYEQGMTIREVAAKIDASWKQVRVVLAKAKKLRVCGQKLARGYSTMYATNGERVTVHRNVMIQKLGRKLTVGETVHHINGKKLDNRPENLSVVTRKEHGQRHRQLHLLALRLVELGMIAYSDSVGYTFSSALERFLKFA